MRSSYRCMVGAGLVLLMFLSFFKIGHVSQTWKRLPSWYNHASNGSTPTNDNSAASGTAGAVTIAELTAIEAGPIMSIEELPTTTEGTKIIVMAKLDQENTSWVSAELSDWQNAIYTVDNPKALLHLDTNKGREANAYLTYLVQNYESLPDTIVFLHSHRKGWPEGWHTDATDYDNVNSLRSLRIDSVQRDGYVNLRCLPTPGCPDEIQPFRDPPHGDGTEYAFGEAWEHIFGNKDVPKVVGIACCSQYAVSKRQVLRRPKSDYERFLAWLLDTKLDDDISGRVLEYMWHIIFGKNAVLEVLSAPVDCDLANGSQLP